MRERLGVSVETAEMGGVKVFVVTPRRSGRRTATGC
jgi:hypothetical protein